VGTVRVAHRPFGILVLAVLSLAAGLWALAAVAGLRQLDDYRIGQIQLPPEVPLAVTAAWGVLLLVAAVLLFVLNRWGWTILMLTTGLGLFGALWQWWIGNLEPVRLGLLVLTAFYLNGRETRDLLLGSRDQVAVVPLAPPEGGRR
jgi:hypothetical protein